MELTPYQTPAAASARSDRDTRLRAAAVELEATFLTEMLKSAGFGETRETLGGGAGESQFSSIMVRAQAEQIARAGGVGLSEMFFDALKEVDDAK